MARNSLINKLESFRLLIFNSSDAELAPMLSEVGIDEDYLKEGRAMYTKTMALVDGQVEEYHEQSIAYNEYYEAKDIAESNYNRTRKTVKLLARNNTALLGRLNLDVSQETATAAWITGAAGFYKHLKKEKEFLTKLERFKVTAKRLKTEQAAIEELNVLRDKASAEKGQAQHATKERDDSMDALTNYCVELRELAKIALETKPQLMEKLGVLVRS